jgi:hypothetical protein
MDFSFSEHEEAFRREVREFLAAHNPNGPSSVGVEGEDIESAMDRLPKLLAWNQALHETRGRRKSAAAAAGSSSR